MADINLGVGGANSATGGYDIDNSLKFESDNSEYLSRTPSSAGNRKTWTLSCWVKRTELTADSNSAGNQHMILSAGDTYIQFDGNAIWVNFRASSVNYFLATNRLFRDTSAWYHIVLVCDTTESTASNRAKLYINGVQETSLQNSTYDNMSQNYDTLMNSTNEHEVGKYSNEETTYANFFSGYIAEMHLVDGTALAPTDFGETDDSGIWKPKQYTGSHGTNGFYLDFEDSSSLGADDSGNGNNFTPNNIAAADQATDTPTNNFNIINPNQGYYLQGNTYYSYTDGNTKQENTLGNIRGAAQTMSVNKGKWYCEWKYTAGTDQQIFVGILAQDEDAYNVEQNAYSAATTCTWYPKQQLTYYKNNGTLVTASATRNSGISAGDVIGMFLDMDNNHLYFQKNGSDINVGEVDASTLLFKESNLFDCNDQYVCFYANTYDTPNEITWNWGGINLTGETTSYSDANGYGAFKYEPVRGSDNYYALCTKNLAEYG